ncbi:hypothetical protein [Tengunoibacter tsumagoiensis]|uniref:DNA topology modulation protein FlaR n=1 Tax=Tengunoibacter tsumagoiensis TaxID=2014871 RepID=A0A402A8R8_9CHLR|nr:hypothetical protein [Tengunoibacter tsumagoiensis]GCE15375.1 DNA topology modulation protein FlaR [Tengunoibacter tsumagoiensis]
MLKIHIVGGSGSGKTTLGAEIGAKFGLPFYELDTLGRGKWIDELDVPARESWTDERDWLNRTSIKSAFKFTTLPGWVIEGNSALWTEPMLHDADYIILLQVSWRMAASRIIRRHIIKSLLGNNPHPGIKSLISFMRDTRQFYFNQCDQQVVEAMSRCLEDQRADTEPPDAERLLMRLEAYGREVVSPPTRAFLYQYLEKYKQKLIIVKNNRERAQLLTFLAQQHKERAEKRDCSVE